MTIGYHTKEQIDQAKKIANDNRRHVGDRLEALCDLYDLYSAFVDSSYYHRRKDEIVDSIRELVRTEI